MVGLKIGDRAPDFALPDAEGNTVTLSSLLEEGPVVLYFYPRDHTTVCTREACGFRDANDAFLEKGARVVGVSPDGAESHRSFRGKYDLPFQLLSDETGEAARAYGVGEVLGLLPGRATFVIDREGIVREVFESQIRAKKHVETALERVRRL